MAEHVELLYRVAFVVSNLASCLQHQHELGNEKYIHAWSCSMVITVSGSQARPCIKASTTAGVGSICGTPCLASIQMRHCGVEAGLLTCDPSSPLRTFKVTLSPTLKSSSAIARSAALVTLRALIPVITSPAVHISLCHCTSARAHNMIQHKGHMCWQKLGEVVAYVQTCKLSALPCHLLGQHSSKQNCCPANIPAACLKKSFGLVDVQGTPGNALCEKPAF